MNQNNPTYTGDVECLILMYVYMHFVYMKDQKTPIMSHPITEYLSDFLQSLVIHHPDNRESTFRNKAGIAMEMRNIHSIVLKTGLPNVNKAYKQLVEQYGTRYDLLRTEVYDTLDWMGIKPVDFFDKIDSFIEEKEQKRL